MTSTFTTLELIDLREALDAHIDRTERLHPAWGLTRLRELRAKVNSMYVESTSA